MKARLPGYHWWESVTGRWWYLWRRKTSPPDVQRFGTRAELVAELEQRAADQERWDAEHN